LADELLQRGYAVTAIDNLSTGRLRNIAHLEGHPHFQFVRASIDDRLVLDRLASEVDVIVHLAASVPITFVSMVRTGWEPRRC